MRCRLPSYQRICVDRRIGICFFDGRRRKVLATCPCQSVGRPRLNVESHRVSCSVQSIDNLTLLTKAGYITTLSLSGYHHLPLLLRHTAAPVYLKPVPVFGVSAVSFIALPYASLVGRAEQIGFFQHHCPSPVGHITMSPLGQRSWVGRSDEGDAVKGWEE